MLNETSDRRTPVAERIVLILSIVLIAISVFFRFWHLGNIPALSGDEAVNGAASFELLHGHSIDWITPTGHIYPITYLGPVLLLHAIFPPSIVLLRLTAVVCGIAAIAVNYILCRRLFGQSCALLTSLLIAVLPENIALSRLGWEPCESVLIDLVVVYGSLAILQKDINLKRSIPGTVVACILALMAQPTNAFVTLFLPIAIIMRWAPKIAAYLATGNKTFRYAISATTIALAIVVGMLALHRPLALMGSLRHFQSRAFILDYAALFSGRTIYNYIGGYPRPFDHVDAIDILSVLPWVLCAVLAARGKANDLDRFVAIGWLIQLAAFASIAGAVALEPSLNRFGICLISPGVLLFVRTLERSTENRILAAQAAQFATLALSALLLIGFYNCYFRYIIKTGGNSEPAFRTAATDPKQTAFEYVQSQCPASRPCYVVCSSWWNYQPARYFAAQHSNIHVLKLDEITPAEGASCLIAMKLGNFWTIDFIDERPLVRKTLAIPGIQWQIIAVPDYAGRPIVIIGHPALGEFRHGQQ